MLGEEGARLDAAHGVQQLLPDGTAVPMWAEGGGDDSAARARAALSITLLIGGAVLLLACAASCALAVRRTGVGASRGAVWPGEKELLHEEDSQEEQDDEDENDRAAAALA